MMLSKILIHMFLISFACAQLDGEFWWLNDKLAKYTGTRPDPPKFEKLTEFDTDENVNIEFKDNDILSAEREDRTKMNKNDENIQTLITWPEQDELFYDDKKIKKYKKQPVSENAIDSFIFELPKTNKDLRKANNNNRTSTTPTALEKESNSMKIIYNDMATFPDKVFSNLHPKDKLSGDSCAFMKKSDCKLIKGSQNNNDIKHEAKENSDLICCSLSENKNEHISPKIYFPGDIKHINRPKRSDNIALKQRNILLKHRYANSYKKLKPETKLKISTPDYEYDDPYWNIRSVENTRKELPESGNSYSTEDFVEDYSIELPSPGLTGIYSDNEKRPSGWLASKPIKGSGYGGIDDVDDDYSSFGYSTIDPRIGTVTKRKPKPPVTPKRTTSTTEDALYDPESHTISYQSNPDFHVLQGFKLLNLFKDKNTSKLSKHTTTKSISVYDDIDSEESVIKEPLDTSSGDDVQVYKDCGQRMMSGVFKGQDKHMGYTQNGSHPWLALLVGNDDLNNVLCYASLIHPRAAITAADCVHGSSSGEITLFTGLWNFNKREAATSRVVSFLVHPKYKNEGLDHNLAIVHWSRPLKLGPNVWPICISHHHLYNDCMFFGWGGFDQDIRSRPQWQRASVHSCKGRLSLNGVNVPNYAFCASVRTRSTVTGIGGSLVCKVSGHASAVGVAVSRDSTLVLLPVDDWVTEAIGRVLN